MRQSHRGSAFCKKMRGKLSKMSEKRNIRSVFGTAYSYKFQGAFDANGLDGTKQTALINNLKKEEIDGYIMKIDKAFNL